MAPINTSSPGGPDDVKALLRQIKSNLEYQGASIGVLIAEVRDSLKGRGENTVKTTIQQEFANLHRDMMMIHDALRNGTGGGPTRTGGEGGLAGPDRGFQRQELDALQRLVRRVEELEAEIAVLNQGTRRGGIGGTGNNAFETTAITRRFQTINDLFSNAAFLNQTASEQYRRIVAEFTTQGGVLHQQYLVRQKQAILSIVDLAAKAFDLVNIFDRLGTFIKTQIVDRYAMFQKDRSLGLTGWQTFADDFQRIFERGITNAGISYKDTTDAVKKNVEGGGAPTTLIYGNNIAQLSARFDSILRQMQARGVDPMQTFSPQELMQFMQNQANFMRQSQTFNQMRPDQQTELMTRSMVYWSDIAKYTGVSAAKLEELAKKTEEETNELQALGMVNADQRNALRQSLPVIEKTFGPDMKKFVVDFIRVNQNPALFMSQNQDFVRANQLANGTLLPALQQLTASSLKQQDAKSFLENAMSILNRTQGASGGDIVAGINMNSPGVGKALGAFQAARGYQGVVPEKQEDNDLIRQAAGTANLWSSRFPQITSLLGTVAGGLGEAVKFTAELGIASVALRGLSSFLPMLARVALPAAGAAVAGGVGAGIALPVAAGVGIGGLLYALLSGGFGSKSDSSVSPAQASPAVPMQNNVYGPGAAEVAAATSSSYQDSALSLMTQIVQTGAQGNYILGQMYGELARQTGYLRGDPNGAGGGVPYNGQGLSANVSPAVSGTRPDASNPYVGPGA